MYMSNIPKTLVSDIKNWISYDNYLKENNKKIKSVKDNKNKLESNILRTMKSHNLMNTKFKIGSGSVHFKESVTTPSLSFKFIEDSLSKHLPKEKVEVICNILKTEKESNKKINYNLKRTN